MIQWDRTNFGTAWFRLTLRRKTWKPLAIAINMCSKHKGRCWSHGDAQDPTKWPWWKLIHFTFFRLKDCQQPTYRLWIYGRYDARCWDLTFDRREL